MRQDPTEGPEQKSKETDFDVNMKTDSAYCAQKKLKVGLESSRESR